MQYVKIYQDVRSVLDILQQFVPHTAKPTKKASGDGKPIRLAQRFEKKAPQLTSSLIRTNANLGQSSASSQNDRVKGKLCYNASISFAGTTASIAYRLSDLSGSTTLTEMGKIFRYFRFNRVLVHLPAPVWSTADLVSVSYVPSGTVISVGPLFTEIESEHQVIYSDQTSVETQLAIPKVALNPQHVWFLTQGDGSEPNADTQGQLIFAPHTLSSETIYFQLTLEYEFCCLLDPVSLTEYFQNLANKSQHKQCTHL
jgi:hypothetical protein